MTKMFMTRMKSLVLKMGGMHVCIVHVQMEVAEYSGAFGSNCWSHPVQHPDKVVPIDSLTPQKFPANKSFPIKKSYDQHFACCAHPLEFDQPHPTFGNPLC